MEFVQTDLLAAGGNRHPAAADWDPVTGLLAYGAGSNIAIWSPLDSTHKGATRLLSGHTDVVNVVNFVNPSDAPESGINPNPILVTGSADKTIRVWRSCNVSDPTSFELVRTLEGHTASINCITVLPAVDLMVSGSANGNIIVWNFHGSAYHFGTIELRQTVSLQPRFFPLAIAVASLHQQSGGTQTAKPNGILAVAGTTSKIQIHVVSKKDVTLVATLTGHEGWIRALAFVRESGENSDLLLASASQDRYVRLWRVHQGEELPAASAAAQDPALGILGRSLSNKPHRFTSEGQKYSVTFEALLLVHEDWIFSASWHKDPKDQSIRLLTASADNSLVVWSPDPASGIWTSIARLGELSAQKGSTTATGSTGGFWVGLWSPSGDAVVSLGRTGSWRLWKHLQEKDIWEQEIAVSGHVREVKSLSWAPDGSYLLTTSSDQTTRLWAEWKREGVSSWHEFSRPQIHGYDLNIIDTLSSTRFVSGADEKLLRVFDLPGSVAHLMDRLCGVQLAKNEQLPDAANIPVLGLSNKAIENTEAADSNNDEAETAPVSNILNDLAQPPTEDHLARHMLWPETEKLYGHGYEISTAAASHDGSLIATACRASSIDHAVIRIYETKDWREVKPPLQAHSLTITRLAFSQDDKCLLSVGRDRQFVLWQRKEDASQTYDLKVANAKAHSRMVLDCSWAPMSSNSDTAEYVFATAGRDKSVKIWRIQNEQPTCVTTISASLPVTAVAFNQNRDLSNPLLAFGLEDGLITIVALNSEDLQVNGSVTIERPSTSNRLGVAGGPPSKSISALSWRPKRSPQEREDGTDNIDSTAYQLAVASDDTSVRIYNVRTPFKP